MAESAELRKLVQADDLDGLFAAKSAEEIADAWWRYHLEDESARTVDHPDWWAVELWFRTAIYKETERGLGLIHALAERAPSGADLGLLGAGPVENYISNEEWLLSWIEEEAARSENYRTALGHVWRYDDLSPEAFARIEAAARTRLARPARNSH